VHLTLLLPAMAPGHTLGFLLNGAAVQKASAQKQR
jgi:hypothetical protein